MKYYCFAFHHIHTSPIKIQNKDFYCIKVCVVAGLAFKNTAASPKKNKKSKRHLRYHYSILNSFLVRHLASFCYGFRRFTWSHFIRNSLPGDSSGFGHHSDSTLTWRDLVLFRCFLCSEVKTWRVEAERPRDINLTSDFTLPLGLRRTLRGYLEKAWRRGRGNRWRQKEEAEEEVKILGRRRNLSLMEQRKKNKISYN